MFRALLMVVVVMMLGSAATIAVKAVSPDIESCGQPLGRDCPHCGADQQPVERDSFWWTCNLCGKSSWTGRIEKEPVPHDD